MSGHGYVTPNADGSKARCGGPGICPQCSVEKAAQRTRPVFGLSEADHREAFLTVPLYYAAINERDAAEQRVRDALGALRQHAIYHGESDRHQCLICQNNWTGDDEAHYVGCTLADSLRDTK